MPETDALILATVRNRGKGNPGRCAHMNLLWNPVRTLAQLWRELGFSGCCRVINPEKRNKIWNNCRFIVGLPKKDFLQLFVKDAYTMLFCFTMICIFFPLENNYFLHFFFLNFIWHFSLLHLPADGMLSMSWGCYLLTLFQRNGGLHPAHVQEESHLPGTLLHLLWLFCLIAGKNQNTKNIWRNLKGRGKKEGKKNKIEVH